MLTNQAFIRVHDALLRIKEKILQSVFLPRVERREILPDDLQSLVIKLGELVNVNLQVVALQKVEDLRRLRACD